MIYKIKFLSYLCCTNLLLVASCSVKAQQNTYLIFLKDKGSHTVGAFDFSTVLSPASIARRMAQNIAFTTDDLPLWSAYLAQITEKGGSVVGRSKWLNAAIVHATPAQLSDILALSCVREVMLLKKGNTASARKAYTQSFQMETFTETPNSHTYLQNSWLSIPDMHRLGYKGKNITIAVFDNGFARLPQIPAFKHIFDNRRLLATYNFVTHSTDVFSEGRHGTQVLSVLAGVLPDSFMGVAPEAHYILCATEESNAETRLEEANWLLAAEFADSAGAHIINSSLGYNTFDDTTTNYQTSDLGKHIAIISRAAEFASQKGMLVVNSAGNEGNNKQWRRLMFPADAPSVVAVAAVNRERRHANFSSWGYVATTGIKPDIAALGDLTVVLDTSGRIGFNSGTSFAAPLIAGFAAGLWQAFPTATAEQIRQAILQAGDRFTNPDTLLGNGIPQFNRAFYVLGDSSTVIAPHITVYPTYLSDEFNVSFSGFYGKNFRLHLLDPTGKALFTWEAVVSQQAITFPIPTKLPKGTALVLLEIDGKIWQQKVWMSQ